MEEDVEVEDKEDRVKELTQKISETRIGVTEVKATIDGMRTTRDNYMSDMNQLKASARDQNQRYVALFYILLCIFGLACLLS